nr:hypothetical protein [Tanacetum cinerariifolium]
ELTKLDLHIEEAEFTIHSLEAEIALVQTEISQSLSQTATFREESIANDLRSTERLINEELDDARHHAIAYIKAKIAGHFDEDLINELYQKIEPHPTLKHIKFVPELDGNRPGLDILVSDTINGYDKAPVAGQFMGLGDSGRRRELVCLAPSGEALPVAGVCALGVGRPA